jgi:hypothetical protein
MLLSPFGSRKLAAPGLATAGAVAPEELGCEGVWVAGLPGVVVVVVAVVGLAGVRGEFVCVLVFVAPHALRASESSAVIASAASVCLLAFG